MNDSPCLMCLPTNTGQCYENHGTGKNLAPGKNAYQSSTPGVYSAARALSEGHGHRRAYCAQTDNDTCPWWLVDLGERLPVSTVVIVNIDAGTEPGSGGSNMSCRVSILCGEGRGGCWVEGRQVLPTLFCGQN